MTSSRSFYVDALILGKHHHHHRNNHHHQQQQQHAEQNDKLTLQLPAFHHSLTSLSQTAFSLHPFISSGRLSTPGIHRGITESGTGRLPLPPACLAAAAGLPTCLCPFCLPLTAAVHTRSPNDHQKQANIETRVVVQDSQIAAVSYNTSPSPRD